MTDTVTEVPSRSTPLLNPHPGHCRTCDEPVPYPRQYCDEHRPAKTASANARKRSSRAKGKRLTPTQVRDSGSPVREVVRDLAEDAKVTPGKAPTLAATNKLLGKLIYYIFLAIVMAAVSSDRTLTDAEQEQVAGELALSAENAEAIAHPFARLLTPTGFWQKSGGTIVANSDVIDAIVAGYEAASGLIRYRRQRARREAEWNDLAARATAPGRPVPPEAGSPPMGPVVGQPDVMALEIPETWGKLPDDDVIAEIRRRSAARRNGSGA